MHTLNQHDPKRGGPPRRRRGAVLLLVVALLLSLVQLAAPAPALSAEPGDASSPSLVGVSLQAYVEDLPSTVEVGMPIDYTIRLWNDGTVDLHNLGINTDDIACRRYSDYTGIPLIAAGDTLELQCRFIPTQVSSGQGEAIEVGVTGTELGGNTPNDLGFVVVTPATAPRLVVVKDVDIINRYLGLEINEPATYTMRLYNVGTSDLHNVQIDDGPVPACDGSFTTLSMGAQTSYSCTYTPTQLGTFTNSATHQSDETPLTSTNDVTLPVHGPQVVPEITGPASSPLNDDITYTVTLTNTGNADLTGVDIDSDLSSDCDRSDLAIALGDDLVYTCSYDPIAQGPVTNQITVTTDQTPATTDSWTTDVTAPTGPDLTLTLDGPAQSTLSQGVPYTVTAYNTGNTALTGLSINSDIEDTCDRSGQSVAVGQNLTYTCTHHPNTAGTVTNQITADSVQSDPDTVQLTTEVLDVGLLVEKSSQEPAVDLGGTIHYSVRVTNTSGQNQSAVAVTDPTAPGCDQGIGDMAPGAIETVTCTLTPTAPGWVINVATASSAAIPAAPSNEVRVKVIDPNAGMQAPLTAEDTILLGQDIHYHLALTNSGTVPLTGLTISDANAPDCDGPVADLAVGASTTVDCTYTPTQAGTRTNQMLIDSNEAALAATNTVSTEVIDADTVLTAVKSADETVQVGEPIHYAIEITNTGDEALTGVAVSDANATGCSGPVADIPVGASTTVQCTFTTMAPGVRTNTAVISTDQLPDLTTNEVSTDVTDPGLIPVKSVDEETVLVGEPIHYAIVIANTSDAALTGVHVDDPNAPGCTGDVADIAVGANATVECTYTPQAPGLRFNTATVSSDQTPDVHTNQVVTNVLLPAMTAQKSVDEPTVEVGEPIHYDIEVSNTSGEALTGVTVADPNAPDCSQAVPDIAVGTSATVSCTYTPTQVGVRTNVATVSSDQTQDVTTNEVSTTVLDPDAGVSAVKTTPDATIEVGDPIRYDIVVANTGTVPLTGVVVDDPNAPDCDRVLPDIAVGASRTVTCTYTPTAPGVRFNLASVTTDQRGTVNTNVVFTNVTTPGLAASKTVDATVAEVGTPLTYGIEITNTSDAPLTGVTVSDPNAPDCSQAVGGIAVGASATVECTYTPTQVGVRTNVATVSADQTTAVTTNEVTTTVTEVGTGDPGLAAVKSAEDSIVLGDDIHYDIEVTNTSDAPLTGVAVSDPNAPDCNIGLPDIAVGASATVSCTYTPTAVGVRTNVATVSSDQTVDVPTNEVSTTVTEPTGTPALEATKSGSLWVELGDAIDYEIQVVNAGDQALTGVSVDDPNAPACSGPVPDLPVGGSHTVQCQLTPTQVGEQLNVATVSSDQVEDVTTNEVTTTVVEDGAGNPFIEVEKSAPTWVELGTPIDYDILITNTGDTPLTGITLSDEVAPACEAVTVPDIAVGDDFLVECQLATTQVGDQLNVATVVSNMSPEGADSNEVRTVVVEEGAGNPFVDAEKTAPETVALGEDIAYGIVITNTGDEPLTNISVEDDGTPACATDEVPDIPVGESHTVECVFTTTEPGTRTNVATVFSDQSPEGVVTNEVSTEVTTCVPTFSDVQENHPFFEEICWMVDNEITTGYSDGTYRPGRDVTRMAMSAFMYRLAGQPAFPDPTTATFPDVPTNSTFFTEIEWMADRGITTGYANGTYRPAIGVTRMAMSAFMYRLAGEPAFPDPATATFPDVPTNSTFFTEIEWMAEEGITTGYTNGTYRPAKNVTRMAMSAFMQRLDPLLPG